VPAGSSEILKLEYTYYNDMIDAQIKNPIHIINNLKNTAKASGANTLILRGTLANPRFYDILVRRYGMVTSNGFEKMVFKLK